jgi:hypothetical protein
LFAYFLEFLKNPKLFNSTLYQTAMAFAHFYLRKKDYIQLFDYLEWREPELQELITKNGWLSSESRNSSWRVGDATSAFYNVAYLFGAGFSENDTFLSNQVRQGSVTREVALKVADSANEPDLDGFLEYCKLTNLNPTFLFAGIRGITR